MSEAFSNWLAELGLGKYMDAFAENAIDFRTLPALTDDDLKELGLKLGHRRLLQQAIASRAADGEPSAAPSPSPESAAADTAASLATWERHPGERKPVTMLFADTTGSTALTEKLDAEEAHALLYGATQRMCEAIEQNRGTVCRFMGDGVMGMFGAPLASEHHAVDACEAALAMQQAIRDYASELGCQGSDGLRIRVGLHSGEVVVLTIGDGDKLEYDASGPTVPIAARMEQSAAPGEVYLTAATQALATRRIEVRALDSIAVKGISKPVPMFSLLRVRSPEEALADSPRTAFVGRRAELGQLRGLLDSCIEESLGQAVYVRGDPGIGKTRLVEELTRIAGEKGVACHRGLVLPFGVGKGQDAARALVRGLLDITPGGGSAERRSAGERALEDGRLDPEESVFLNDLLDLAQPTEQRVLYDAMDNDTRNEGKQRVVSKLLTAATRARPMLVVVEDAHWADPLTLGHLSALARAVAECPALLVMTSRIEGDQLDQTWRTTIASNPFVSIDLGPLRVEDAIALIGEFIDTGDELAKSCLQRAAGNPLFLEQLVRNAREGTTESLPDSIQSLVLARMDRLEAVDKRALQAASVIGQRFDADAMHSLLETESYDCRKLVEHNLIRPIAGGYLFTHALIQESVYGSLLKSQRRELHGKAARHYAGSDLILYAEHLAHAGDERASEAFLVAAREEAKRYRLDRALSLTRRGLETSPEEARFELECLKGELLRDLASTKESLEAFRQARDHANSDVARCRAAIGIAEGLRIVESHDELLEVLDSAQAIAVENDLSRELARIHQLRGGVHFLRGERDECIAANEVAMRHAETAGSHEITAQALSGLGDAEYARGRMLSAHRHFDRCIEISRMHGFGKSLAANLVMRGAVMRHQCERVEVMRDFDEAIRLSEETGQARALMIGLYAGECLAEWGELEEGERWLKRRLNLSRRLGARAFEAQSLAEIGRIAYLTERLEEAEKLADEGVEILRQHGGMAFTGAAALGVLSLVARNPARRREAMADAEEILKGRSVSHNYLRFYPDAMETCLEMEEWDDVDRYARALEGYTAAEPLVLSDFYIARGRTLATHGRGGRSPATMAELQRLREQAEQASLTATLPALKRVLASA